MRTVQADLALDTEAFHDAEMMKYEGNDFSNQSSHVMLKIEPTQMPLSPAQLTNTSGLGLIPDFRDTQPPEEAKE